MIVTCCYLSACVCYADDDKSSDDDAEQFVDLTIVLRLNVLPSTNDAACRAFGHSALASMCDDDAPDAMREARARQVLVG